MTKGTESLVGISIQDIQAAAERFRHYARQCREFALTKAGIEMAASLEEHARQWERDAECLERDAEMIARSRQLLDKVKRLLERVSPVG